MIKESDKNYWTKETDDAIWEYLSWNKRHDELGDNEVNYQKDRIYASKIHKPLTTLVESLVNRYKLSASNGTELSMDWLRSECYMKFLDVANRGYLKPERGRPFNYLTSVLKFHMIAVRRQNQKQKQQLESHYYENEEYIYNESESEPINIPAYVADMSDPDDEIGAIQYHKIIEYLREDIDNDAFSSSKEKIFAEQLLEVMNNLHKFSFQNKFFIKFMLGELSATAGIEMKRFTINYYLLKFWKRYQKRMEKELS